MSNPTQFNQEDRGGSMMRLVWLREKAITILELARPIASDDPDPVMKTLLELVNDIIAATEPNATAQTPPDSGTKIMDKLQDPEAETAQIKDSPAVDLPQLVLLCLKRGDKPYELQGDVCGDETCSQCGQSIWATDFEEHHRDGHKSDRNQNSERHPDAIHLKTLCTGCKKPMDCYWPPTTTFGGDPCTAEEYMAKALQSESVGIYCDDCMERMPDVKLGDLHFEPNETSAGTDASGKTL